MISFGGKTTPAGALISSSAASASGCAGAGAMIPLCVCEDVWRCDVYEVVMMFKVDVPKKVIASLAPGRTDD